MASCFCWKYSCHDFMIRTPKCLDAIERTKWHHTTQTIRKSSQEKIVTWIRTSNQNRQWKSSEWESDGIPAQLIRSQCCMKRCMNLNMSTFLPCGLTKMAMVTFKADTFKDISPTPLSHANLFFCFHKTKPGKGSGSGLFVPKQIPEIPEWDLKGEACFLLFPVSLLRQVKMAPSYFNLSSSSHTVAFPSDFTSLWFGFRQHGYVDLEKSSIRLTLVSQCPLDILASLFWKKREEEKK